MLLSIGLGVAALACGVSVLFARMPQPELMPHTEIRQFLESESMRGPLAEHPDWADFPMKGVFAFDGLKPALWVDSSRCYNLVENEAGTQIQFDSDMWDLTFQSGPGDPAEPGSPYGDGYVLAKMVKLARYRNRFICPGGRNKPLEDGAGCRVVGSSTGLPYWLDIEGRLGAKLRIYKEQAGREWHRDTWILPPWKNLALNDANEGELLVRTPETMFHHYKFRRLVDGNGTIDEQNLKWLLETKLQGSEGVLYWPYEA